jgi:hypothetical protein
MQDGPAITHNDLSSAEGLRLILEGEATTSLHETVTSMGHQIQIYPDDLDSFAVGGDMSDDILFTRPRRFLLELLLLWAHPVRVLVSYACTVRQWPCPPSAEYNTRLTLGQDLAADGRDPFRQPRHFSRNFGLPEELIIAVATTNFKAGRRYIVTSMYDGGHDTVTVLSKYNRAPFQSSLSAYEFLGRSESKSGYSLPYLDSSL